MEVKEEEKKERKRGVGEVNKMTKELAKEWVEELNSSLQEQEGNLSQLEQSEQTLKYRIRIWHKVLVALEKQPYVNVRIGELEPYVELATKQLQELEKKAEQVSKERREITLKLEHSNNYVLVKILRKTVKEDLVQKEKAGLGGKQR